MVKKMVKAKKKICIRKPDKFGDWWVTIGGKPYEFARTKAKAKKIVDKIRMVENDNKK